MAIATPKKTINSIYMFLMEKLCLSKELLNENELRDLSQHYSISYNDLKSEQWLYKNKIKDQKTKLSQATKFILENNFHIAFSSKNELFKILQTRYQSIPANLNQYRLAVGLLVDRSSPIYLIYFPVHIIS